MSNLLNQSAQLLDYMKESIRLLGGVMLKAQDLYWTQSQVDIENCMTLSALAISIFRMIYYDPNRFPIHIPSRNEDTFIRRGMEAMLICISHMGRIYTTTTCTLYIHIS